jgi:hypothetical protein
VNSDSHFQTSDGLRERLSALRVAGHTWDEIAALAEFGGSSAGLLSSVLKGYEPKTNATRARLNLPPLTGEAPFCATHNEVHCWDCETQQVQPKPASRPKRQPRNRRPYKNIDPTDPTQVRRQIERYMPGWELVKKEGTNDTR